MSKSKASLPQLPSAAADDDFPLMDDIENDANLEDNMASYETDSSECKYQNDENFYEEMPSMDTLDPVDPMDRIEGDKSVDDNPIYPNARITYAVSMLLIMTFALKHKLSGVAIRDLLSLIDIHCLVPNPLLKSLFKFKQYFQSLKNPLKKHHFCSKCSISLKEDSVECPNVACKEKFDHQSTPFFIELSIIDQLKALFNRQGFYSDLAHRFNRHQTDNIEDIYDGVKYKQYMKKGKFLANRNNISLIWNTDGIPVLSLQNTAFGPSIWQLMNFLLINDGLTIMLYWPVYGLALKSQIC